MADISLLCFLSILGKVASTEFKISKNEDFIIERFMEAFKLENRGHSINVKNSVKMELRMSLHCGKAFEGVIGSSHKIDGNYISPELDILTHLNQALDSYNVPLIFTGEIYALLSEEVKMFCRKIDRVLFKEAERPIDIFTLDTSLDYLEKDKTSVDDAVMVKIFKARKKYILQSFINGDKDTSTLFYKDKRISDVCYLMGEDYYELWHEGVREYLKGNWAKALEIINKTLDRKRNDPPNKFLLRFI